MNPGSLVDSFAPPAGYTGDFGWVCGYSGDADFMDLACERFTGSARGPRGYAGRVWLGLMLDPSSPQIAPSAVPGVLHLLASGPLPFRLLHAKVALLCFRREGADADWCLRLVISTGNWTRQTLEQSLDLVWRFDVSRTDLGDSDIRQAAVDLRAAAAMFADLRERFALGALTDAPGTVADENRQAMARLEAALAVLPRASRADPVGRFFDNRSASLLAQLPGRVRANAGTTRRNNVYLGAGFFEGVSREGERPKVVERILESLQKNGEAAPLLTAGAAVTLVVNPAACQQVAAAGPALAGWSVCAAHDPVGGLPRSLHAKFVFSAGCREGSDRCSSAWLYLGSGNFTPAGFLHPAGPGGNLEAAVVIEAEGLTWRGLPELLPLDAYAPDLAASLTQLQPGGDAPPRPPATLAPPFAFLSWSEGADGSWLSPPEAAVDASAEVDGPLGTPCLRASDGRYAWTGEVPPIEVVVRWATDGELQQARVPVLDRFGRLAGRPLPVLDFAGILDELGAFPQLPEDEGDDGAFASETDASSVGAPAPPDRTPIWAMMQLVEKIAARHDDIHELAWPGWCSRLEQTLLRGKDSDTIDQIRALGIDPLGVLLRREFRPAFAETRGSPAGALYEAVLGRIREAWRLSGGVPLVPEEWT